MPDALETVIQSMPDVASFKEGDVLERYKDGFGAKPEVAPEPAPEVTKEPEVVPAKTDDGIPDEILGISKPKVEEEDLLVSEPKGQLKNENYKKLQAHARARIEAEQAEKATIRKELEEIRSKLKEDYVPEKISKQLEEYQTRLKEREEELGKLAVERSPMFKERFSARQEGLVKQLSKVGKDLGLDEDTTSQLLNSTGKRRFDMLEDLEINSSAKGYITSLLQQHDQVESDKSEFLSNWQAKKAEMEMQESQQSDAQKARMKEMEDKIFTSTLENLSKTFAPLRKIEGNDKWNAQVEAIHAEAKRFFDGEFTTPEYAEIALAGVAAKPLYAMYEKVRGMYEEVAAENARLKAASPTAPPVGTKPPVQDDSKLTLEERAKRTFDLMVGSAANNGMR